VPKKGAKEAKDTGRLGLIRLIAAVECGAFVVSRVLAELIVSNRLHRE